MSTASVKTTVAVLGKSIIEQHVIESDGGVIKDPSLPAAKVGQLTTRTDANTGVLTMTGGHGITTGARLHLYWEGGSRTCTVGTVATNSVPIDLGIGDDLPANLTAITAMVPHQETFPIPDTAALAAIGVQCDRKAIVQLEDSSDAAVAILKTTSAANAPANYWWDENGDAANPLLAEADVAKAYMSHGDSTAARVVSVVGLFN